MTTSKAGNDLIYAATGKRVRGENRKDIKL